MSSTTAPTLTLSDLQTAIDSHAAAFRCVTEYQPAGGKGDKVFPPTYDGGKYAVEKRVAADIGEVSCVLLDSVQSQANRMELALLEACRAGRIRIPLVTATFDSVAIQSHFTDQTREAKGMVITSLEAPHRVADAIFRDCLLNGVIFRKSAKGRLLDSADVNNATGLFGLNPTALVFGLWDSAGPRGRLGAKFQRALVSEIVGYQAQDGVKTWSRIEPLGIMKESAVLYQRDVKGDEVPDWTLDKDAAVKGEKGEPKRLRKDGKPSEALHGNVTPSIAAGGFTISHAKQTTVLSLTTLRRLRFPLNGGTVSDPDVDRAARVVLAALGLLGAVLAREQGADLRSRCQLFPSQDFVWELLDTPGEAEHKQYCLSGDQAVALFNTAVEQASARGLPWEGEIILQPSDELIQLVARSQEMAQHQAEGYE